MQLLVAAVFLRLDKLRKIGADQLFDRVAHDLAQRRIGEEQILLGVGNRDAGEGGLDQRAVEFLALAQGRGVLQLGDPRLQFGDAAAQTSGIFLLGNPYIHGFCIRHYVT